MKFQYYNHSYIPEIPEIPICENLSFSQIDKDYKSNGGDKSRTALLASYITAFDVAEQSEWYFTIKDDKYDLSILPAKKRYEITKAHKYCIAEEINPLNKIDELFEVYKESFSAYPNSYRPKEILFEPFKEYIHSLYDSGSREFYAVFFLENKKMCGFLIIEHRGIIIGLQQQKTIPFYEKYNCNAALIDYVLTKYNEQLSTKKVFFSNGSRNIKHKTNFNSYLEKYFGFRKAYSQLRIVYRFPLGFFIKMLKPFKRLFSHTTNHFFYNIYCILEMDSYTKK